jgi:hypothetical protein
MKERSTMASNRYNAAWWSKDNDSNWEKVKEAFRRDWEQTKHDLGASSPDLNQDVPDTVKQAAGKKHIPPPGVANFEDYEPALRYGYGARNHYGKQYPTWDSRLEETLKKDWSSSEDWKRYSKAVRRGYEFNPKP